MKFIIILLLNLHLVIPDEDLEEGSNCTTFTNEDGICKYDMECEYTKKLWRDKKKIKTCFWTGMKRFVCCVETERSITPETRFATRLIPEESFEDEFKSLHKIGLLKSGYTECRFNGTFPIKCCRVVDDFTALRFNEPPSCEELEKPSARQPLSPHQSVIYDACYAYSRLGSKCLEGDVNSDVSPRDDCQRFRSQPKISDGDPAKVEEFPHMAVLGGKRKNSTELLWFGGGSLISEYYILTAAHAVGHPDVGTVKLALMGTLYKNDTRSGEVYHITNIIKHPEHSTRTKKNDIALLKLHRRVVFSDFIRPACLTFPGIEKSQSSTCIVAGWGNMGQKSDSSNILLKAFVYQENNHDQCKKNLHQRSFEWDRNTMICAKSGEERPQQDSCQGDSGGPLMTTSNKYVPCSYFVSGIVSWGSYCGKHLLGAYTNASNDNYQEWIVKTVWPVQLDARKTNPPK